MTFPLLNPASPSPVVSARVHAHADAIPLLAPIPPPAPIFDPPAPSPCQVVMVVCCRLTALQRDLYCRFLESTAARRVLARAEGNKRAGAAGVLSAITTLKKLCNHPKLIYDALHSKVSADCWPAGGVWVWRSRMQE